MSKIGIFMADGCEEIEGLTVVDIVRRAGLDIETISINGKKNVTSSHKVTFETDTTKEEADYDSYDAIVLPGGMPGTLNLGADTTVTKTIKEFAAKGKLVAAICAAPSVLGENHILEGKKATCHPGFEEKLCDIQFLTFLLGMPNFSATSHSVTSLLLMYSLTCSKSSVSLHLAQISPSYPSGRSQLQLAHLFMPVSNNSLYFITIPTLAAIY